MANPYFRALMNWITVIDINDMSQGTTLTLTSNGHTTYRYTGPGAESYYIEARIQDGRSENIPDEGLAIWHINTDGKNTYEDYDNLVAIEQADGLFSLENDNNSGGAGDLFHSGYKTVFNSTTNPDSNWHDGSQSGMGISNISAVDTTMSFTVDKTQSSCEAPTVSLTGTSTNSISISWNDVDADSYYVFYKETEASSWTNAASELTDTNYVITGLNDSTTYNVAVLRICPDGTQPYNTTTAATEESGV